MTNLATIHKVWQKLNEMTNEACWLFAIFAKNDKFGENSEFGNK